MSYDAQHCSLLIILISNRRNKLVTAVRRLSKPKQTKMVSTRIWLVVAFSFCCHGNRLENEISKRKLHEDGVLELISFLRDQLLSLQSDVSYIRRKTKQSYELLKKTEAMNANWTPTSVTERQDVHFAPETAPRGCPEEFPLKRRKSCYRFEGRKLTWQKARDSCRKWNAHLIAIETPDESKFLMNTINSNKDIQHCDFWTDGTDVNKEGTWVWNHTAEPFEFTNWHTQEPNNGRGDEHCMWLDWYFNWKWNDATCNQQKACFVCELPR